MVNTTLYSALWRIFHLNLLGGTSNLTTALSGSLYGLGKVSRKIGAVPFFFNPILQKKLGIGLPLPPHPQFVSIYIVCEKWTKNLGSALPPFIWTKSKRTDTFFGRPSPSDTVEYY